MAAKNHKNSHDNETDLHQQVQTIIATAIGQVANDYETLFAVADFSAAADSSSDSLCERHKQGKIILSHLEALLKIKEAYIEKPQMRDDEAYKQVLIDSARKDLEKS